MSQRFAIQPTPLNGLKLLKRKPRHDVRGYFERLYCQDELGPLFGSDAIVQINHTLTRKAGTLRGMHFQYPPYTEGKLVSCLRGEVFDVALDLRYGSPTFMQWHGEVLSEGNHHSLFIPPGFAHGFQSLCDDCELLYLHSNTYHPEAEGAINAIDPSAAIDWPLPIGERSERDTALPLLSDGFKGLDL